MTGAGICFPGDTVGLTLGGQPVRGVIEGFDYDLAHAGRGDKADIRTPDGHFLTVPCAWIEWAESAAEVAS